MGNRARQRGEHPISYRPDVADTLNMSNETLIITVVVALLFGCGFWWKLMNVKYSFPKPEPRKTSAPAHLIREIDAKMTPKAEAKSANKLPPTEQMNKFEKYLEAHDSGNQPA